MLREPSALETTSGSAGGRAKLRPSAVVSRRALVLVVALLSLALGEALFAGVAGERSSVAQAVRPGGFSHKSLLSLPLAAQGPVSAAMGADSLAYRVSASGGGFTAASPVQRLSIRFGLSGMSLTSGTTHVGLSLRAVGYGTSLTALGQVSPRAKANRVTYTHRGLSEWYANGPLGLEQGFTIPRAPSGHAAGPLTLSMALSGNGHASIGSGGRSIALSRRGGLVLRYTGLSATDARGRALHSWLKLHSGRIVLRVDTHNALFPLRIDPLVQQTEKLPGSGYSFLGDSVALSSDGNTALIGAPKESGEVGAAWVFTRSGESWTQQGENFTGSGAQYQGQFGGSVALSSDGNTALIGSTSRFANGNAAWVFTRSGSTWTQQGEKLTGSGEIDQLGAFGSSVALSSDGNTALIGGPDDDAGVGAVWVFTRSGETWTQQGKKLIGGGQVNGSEFGSGVALSADGNTALIGGMRDDNFAGAAWVFTRSGSTWAQQGEKLSGSGDFGAAVALSSDGTTALIGAPYDNGLVGAAWVFVRSGEAWTQQGEKLTPSGEIGQGRFGNSVALSSDGNTALIGGPYDYGDPRYGGAGAAWVFTRSGAAWTQHGEKLTGSGEIGIADLGASVALSSDGNTALIGGPSDNNFVGAAWVFYQPTGAPRVVTGAASSVAPTSATLNATVNPNHGAVSDCHFDYGTSRSYGSSLPCTSLPGSGEAPVAVAAPVVSLGEDITYHFRIVATNPFGTTYGRDQTFTTPGAEYGSCVRQAFLPHTGKYENATCTKSSENRAYEWYPGVGKTYFTTKSKEFTTVTLLTVRGTSIACKGETGTGEYTGVRTVGGVVLAFTGCERLGEKCATSGAAGGEIVTARLEGVLGITALGETSIKNKIGLDLFPVGKTGAIMGFSCGATSVSVRGSVIGAATPVNAMKLTSTLGFSDSKGRQKPEGFVGAPKDILEASFNEAPFEQTGLKLTMIQTNEEKVEVNSVF